MRRLPDQLDEATPDAIIAWDRALVRSGFIFSVIDKEFHFEAENESNKAYLRLLLGELGKESRFNEGVFAPDSSGVNEREWLTSIATHYSGAEGCRSGIDDCELEFMDPYMGGLVRWTNAVKLVTIFSCDGHGAKMPTVRFHHLWAGPLFSFCLQALSEGRWRWSENELHHVVGDSQTPVGNGKPKRQCWTPRRKYMLPEISFGSSLFPRRSLFTRSDAGG